LCVGQRQRLVAVHQAAARAVTGPDEADTSGGVPVGDCLQLVESLADLLIPIECFPQDVGRVAAPGP
jgi:hypothetical protein